MANNVKKVTTIQIDTGKSVKAVDDLNNEVQELDTSLQGASQSIKDFGDNSGQSVDKVEMMVDRMTNVTKVSAGLVGGFEAVEGTMALFGVESDKVAEALVRMQGLMNLSNGLQSIAEGFEGFKNLRKGAKDAAKEMGSMEKATAKSTKNLKNIGKEGKTSMAGLSKGAKSAERGLTKAGKAGKRSMSGLKKAIIGTGIGALVVIIGSIIANWEEFTKAIGVSEEAMLKIKATFNGVMAVISNGMKHLSSAIGKLVRGDFSGAWDEFKAIVTTADDAFSAAVTKTNTEAAEAAAAAATEAAQTTAEEVAKDQKRYIEMMEAKKGANWKFTEEGKKAYDSYFAQLLASYGKDSDEYHQAMLAKQQYDNEYAANRKKILSDQEKDRLDVMQHDIKMKEIENGADWKFTEEGQAAYKKYFDYRRKLATGDAKELRKITEEEAAFNKDVLDDQKQNDKEARDSKLSLMQHNIKMKEIESGAEWKFTEEGQAAYREYFDKRLEGLEENSAEWLKVKEEEAAYTQQLDNQSANNTAAAENSKTQARAMGVQAFSKMAGEIAGILNSISEIEGLSLEQQKGLQIASTTINGLNGAFMAILTSGLSFQGAAEKYSAPWLLPVGWILGGITAAGILTNMGIQIAKIKQVSKENPEGGGGADAGAPVVDPSALSAVSQSKEVQGAELAGATTEKNAKDTRVYVSETDIKNTGRKVDVAESESTF